MTTDDGFMVCMLVQLEDETLKSCIQKCLIMYVKMEFMFPPYFLIEGTVMKLAYHLL